MLRRDPDRPLHLKARWLFPVTSAPIENGVLEIQQGRITAVGAPDCGQAIDLGNVGLIPGLVNAHTHLEFSNLFQPVQPAEPFTAWIRTLVANRRSQPASSDVIQSGLAECAACGTTSVGEIATQDWPVETYRNADVDSVVFREIIGLRPERMPEQLEVARKWLAAPVEPSSKLIRGLSPHAPYSVHPELYQRLVDLAVQHQAPVAVHLAETRSELEFLDRATGEFVELLQQFGAWDEAVIPKGTRPLDYLRPLAELSRSLVIHGNYLTADELACLREIPSASVVFCPRTHAYFGHTAHPWLRMLAAGINVAIGTDSRGSNPDLNVWEELRFLWSRFPAVNPATILELGTLAGAKALGLERESGSLEPGKHATFAVVKFAETTGTDPYELLFSGAATKL
jgi:cytosine/adenosine deaminase-related metal-dependent hydrolase